MDALEDLFVKILRASNILMFFGIIFAGFIFAKGMPGGEAFLIIMGSAIGGGIYCGWVALVMRMYDELQRNNDNMKTLISAVRYNAPKAPPAVMPERNRGQILR